MSLPSFSLVEDEDNATGLLKPRRDSLPLEPGRFFGFTD
jgi:hypothetical protein